MIEGIFRNKGRLESLGRCSLGMGSLSLRVQVVLTYGFRYPNRTRSPMIESTWTLRVGGWCYELFRLLGSSSGASGVVIVMV